MALASQSSNEPGSASPESDAKGTDTADPTKGSHFEDTPGKITVAGALDWSVKMLSLGCAVLFGVWAPISYQATLNGNAENNATQNLVIDKLEPLSSLDSLQKLDRLAKLDRLDALDQLKQLDFLEELDKLNKLNNLYYMRYRLDGLAQLHAWEFCEGKAASVAACLDLSSAFDVESVLSSLTRPVNTLTESFGNPGMPGSSSARLGGPTDSRSTTTTTTPLPVPTTRPSKSEHEGLNVVAVALGAIFGCIAVIGLVVAFLALRKKRIERGGRLREKRVEA